MVLRESLPDTNARAGYGPPLENEAAAQAGTLGGGGMVEATSQTNTEGYSTDTAPAIVADCRLLDKVARRYPILSRHWGLDDLVDEMQVNSGGSK